MKKIVICVLLLISFGITHSQSWGTQDEVTIEKIDRLQKNVEDFSWYKLTSHYTSLIHWFVDDWIYVVSYEPSKKYREERWLRLYKKNINTNSDWTLASPQILGKHYLAPNETGICFDEYLVQHGGNCRVIALDYENVFVAFITIRFLYGKGSGCKKEFTELFVFVPAINRPDGSIQYGYESLDMNHLIRIQGGGDVRNSVETIDSKQIIFEVTNQRRVIIDGDLRTLNTFLK